MRYVLLIHEPRELRETRNEVEGRVLYAEMVAFGEGLGEQLVASHSLRPDRHGVRVQAQPSKPLLRDGPFTETKEMLGGFYLIDCADMDEALAIAKRCPATRFGIVEVRACAPCYEG
ncbi:YciI family protein [Sulfuriferula nivalis]|uniref:Dehydrogenase n=1 Tax=Sulfuriferula nivalis TaxID=2675298 RepID=A0A809S553_9PROT|nr:YciI family protein [Sulfuriferula nivalis]BBP02288.1 dehydrogenase [Sulfuriferula nivalis]